MPLHKTNKEEEYVLLDVFYEKVNYKHEDNMSMEIIKIQKAC